MAAVTDIYYPSEGMIGYGTQLLVALDGDADTDATVAVAEITTITPGSIDTEDVVRTHLRSPDAHHEHMPGIRDSGAIELVGTLRLDHESQNNSATPPGGLIYLQRTRAIRNFAIQLPDAAGTTLPVRGYVQRFQVGAMGTTGLLNFTAAIMPTESYSADLPGGIAATGATAGTPGTFTPTGAITPANLAAMTGLTASPATAWTSGQHVILNDASHAYWNATTWIAGNAP
jgi:hypothetical protein